MFRFWGERRRGGVNGRKAAAALRPKAFGLLTFRHLTFELSPDSSLRWRAADAPLTQSLCVFLINHGVCQTLSLPAGGGLCRPPRLPSAPMLEASQTLSQSPEILHEPVSSGTGGLGSDVALLHVLVRTVLTARGSKWRPAWGVWRSRKQLLGDRSLR